MRRANARACGDRFLEVFKKHGNVAEAARGAKVARSTIYRWRQEDPEFAAAMDEAEEEFVDRVEEVALSLATGKYERSLVSAGKLVGVEPIYSERMIELILRARRPEVYRESQRIEHSGEVRTIQDLLSAIPDPPRAGG